MSSNPNILGQGVGDQTNMWENGLVGGVTIGGLCLLMGQQRKLVSDDTLPLKGAGFARLLLMGGGFV